MHIKKLLLLIVFVNFIGADIIAQTMNTLEGIPEDYKPYIYADPADVEWFTKARFGVFIHWGPSSLAKVPISWGRYGPRPGAGRQATGGVPKEEYDSLYKIFNPVEFDADEWIKLVRKSGAKYLIFTTKHHDGFCMFDAKNTGYKITNTPFGRDIAKELADACHKHGVKLFWYYSQPDWQHPDCLTENNERYRGYMYEHLEQLLTDYGKIDGIFFDHLGTQSADWDTPRLLKMIRTLQPGIIVNRRWGNNMPGVVDRGDYDNPEQEIGHFQIDRPWETCATMSTAWSWTGGERVKSFETNLRLLIQCAGSGGNLALNTGPQPDGNINPPEVDNYIKIGEWLNKYGETIYGTIGGPYKPGPWGVSTRKGDQVYLHILSKFAPGAPKTLELPDLPGNIVAANLLPTGKTVKISRKNGILFVDLTGMDENLIDNIVVLEYDGNSDEIAPLETVTATSMVPFAATGSSSSGSEKNNSSMVLGRADQVFAEGIKHKGWWAPDKEDVQPWLTVEFDKKSTFNYITLVEQIRNCSTRKFLLEYKKDDSWEHLYTGTQIGMDFSVKIPLTECSMVRLRVLETDKNNPPNISSFRFYHFD